MKSINVAEKFKKVEGFWTPHILSEFNNQYVKIAKVQGEFVWHDHKDEDELFFVIKGKLIIELEGGVIELNPGELYVIPKGTKHRPKTNGEEVWIMLIEPKSTKHTGEVDSELTKSENRFI